MALTGHLSDLSLSELIEFFCNQRKSGQLKVLYPQGYGSFYLQAGSVVDARIGVLRGIDAVYFALTLPNARFEFGGADEPVERTINQPWTQVVLEGLRRLDEGIIPSDAFPPDYAAETNDTEPPQSEIPDVDLESLRVPGFLSFNAEPGGRRKGLVAAAVAFAVIASVAALGVPAGWYGRSKQAAVSPPTGTQPNSSAVPDTTAVTIPEEMTSEVPETSAEEPNDAALAAKRRRDMERAKAREAKTATDAQTVANPAAPIPTPVAAAQPKSGPKKVVVTVTYDESGRVTQASGGDASAVRIARQKRFPPGKAGSATVTIPIH
ncbi:MAG TPA: DUF4388 domain-containing protein [Pyrinomonadaceae bacterium]|nr:DUF4388 domain-containing protein [Pyrinomonadaceae bacterium]